MTTISAKTDGEIPSPYSLRVIPARDKLFCLGYYESKVRINSYSCQPCFFFLRRLVNTTSPAAAIPASIAQIGRFDVSPVAGALV